MRLIKTTLILSLSILTFSCSDNANNNNPTLSSPSDNSQVNTIQTGSFTKGEVPTQGKMRIFRERGKQYIELKQDFKTKTGPDLFIILHRSNQPPIFGVKEQDYVNIASLKQVNGEQRYEIPASINLKNFRSVAIWCRKFNATFGYAPFANS